MCTCFVLLHTEKLCWFRGASLWTESQTKSPVSQTRHHHAQLGQLFVSLDFKEGRGSSESTAVGDSTPESFLGLQTHFQQFWGILLLKMLLFFTIKNGNQHSHREENRVTPV